MKKIENIVFYTINGNCFIPEHEDFGDIPVNIKKSVVYYDDGTYEELEYDDAIDIIYEYAKENKLTNKDVKSMINNNKIYVLSEKKYLEDKDKFVVNKKKNNNLSVQPKIKELNLENNATNYLIASRLVDELNDELDAYSEATTEDEKKVISNKINSLWKKLENKLNVLSQDLSIQLINELHINNSINEDEIAEEKDENFENALKVVEDLNKELKSYNECKDEKEKYVILYRVYDKRNELENLIENIDDNKVGELNSKITNWPTDDIEAISYLDALGLIDSIDADFEKYYNTEDLTEKIKILDGISEKHVNLELALGFLPEFIVKELKDVLNYDMTEEEEKEGFFARIRNKFKRDKKEGFFTRSNNKSEVKDKSSDNKKKGRIATFFSNIKEKVVYKNKNGKRVRRSIPSMVTAICLAAIIGFTSITGVSAIAKRIAPGIFDSKPKIEAEIGDDVTGDEALAMYNNDYYDTYSYDQLLEVNTVNVQKTAMTNVREVLTLFNDDFANVYAEKDKDGIVVKPALTWVEVNALNVAYNNYNDEQLIAIFNGKKIKSSTYSDAYRMANLQLMGAHIIETRDNPVDMSGIINSEEGKEFYNKYHDLYLNIRESDGKELDKNLDLFLDMVKEDFPITDEIREVGIAHSDSRKVASYKYSVVPMIGAVENIYRNNNTLSDKEIDYLNDVAVCYRVDEKYERLEMLTISAEEDNTQPLYQQYRNAVVTELKNDDNYGISDDERDLSKLESFQNVMNPEFENGQYTGEYSFDGVSYSTSERTETKTTYRTETTREEKEIPDSEKDKIDQQIEQENEKAKEEAEKEAEKKQEELQEKADEDTDKKREEVEQDDKDLQDKIDDANSQIDENNKDDDKSNDKPVNEDDLGHGTDFDDDHSDENGNLDESVEDITTDSKDDVTDEALPNPEDTGSEFDGDIIIQKPKQGGTGNQTDQNIFESEEEVPETSKAKSNEDIANEIVESWANQESSEYESGYQYTKM